MTRGAVIGRTDEAGGDDRRCRLVGAGGRSTWKTSPARSTRRWASTGRRGSRPRRRAARSTTSSRRRARGTSASSRCRNCSGLGECATASAIVLAPQHVGRWCRLQCSRRLADTPVPQTPAVQQIPRTPPVDSCRARSRAGALGEPVHRLSRVAGARLRDGSEYHPDENRQLRSLVVHARQRARAVPQGGASDSERQGERELHRRGDRRPRALPSPARQRHDALDRRCSRSPTSWSATRRRAKRISTAPVAAPRVTTPPPAASPAFARASRTTVDLQQRMLFPGDARGRGAPAPATRMP